jgi:hypothetical protein
MCKGKQISDCIFKSLLHAAGKKKKKQKRNKKKMSAVQHSKIATHHRHNPIIITNLHGNAPRPVS